MRSRRPDAVPRRLAYLHEAVLESLFRGWLGGDLSRLPVPPPTDTGEHPAWIARALAAKPNLAQCLLLLAERAEIEGVIVDSAACRDLVRAALGSLADRWRIDVAFHPVEEPDPAAERVNLPPRDSRTAMPLKIGSFELAGDTKRLDLVAQAAAVIGAGRCGS